MKREKAHRMTDADQAFLITLFNDSKDIIKMRIRQKLGDDLDTEDILQNTFETACKRIDKVKESTNPVGWMILTAYNEIKHTNRRRNKIVYFEDIESMREPVAEIDLGLEELLPQNILPEEAALLKRIYEQQEKVRDVAKDIDVGYEALKWRLKRIRDSLKPDMKKLIEGKNKNKGEKV